MKEEGEERLTGKREKGDKEVRESSKGEKRNEESGK